MREDSDNCDKRLERLTLAPLSSSTDKLDLGRISQRRRGRCFSSSQFCCFSIGTTYKAREMRRLPGLLSCGFAILVVMALSGMMAFDKERIDTEQAVVLGVEIEIIKQAPVLTEAMPAVQTGNKTSVSQVSLHLVKDKLGVNSMKDVIEARPHVLMNSCSGSHRVLSSSGFLQGLDERVLQTCNYYADRLPDWLAASLSKEPIVAWQQRSGAGDRFAGLVGAFHYALNVQRPMQVKWNYLSLAFQVPCWMSSLPSSKGENNSGERLEDAKGTGLIEFLDDESSEPPDKNEHDPSCITSSCAAAMKRKSQCTNSPLQLVDPPTSIRACASESRCRAINAWGGSKTSLVHSIGCPLALMLVPSRKLLDDKVQFYMNGQLHDQPLDEMLQRLDPFHIVALHFRQGDAALLQTKKFDAAAFNASLKMAPAVSCMQQVTNYVQTRRARGGNADNKPVKWVIASDNRLVRDYFIDAFPDKVIMLHAPPRHLSKTRPKTSTRREKLTLDTFAEWLLLARSDELLANVGPHGVSAFSKLSRLWALKSRYYQVGTDVRDKQHCFQKEFVMGGNLRLMPPQCHASNPYIGIFEKRKNRWQFFPSKEKLPQPHLN